MKKIVTKIALATLLLSPMGAFASENANKLLLVVTSEDSLTQFMAMVLGNQSQAKGADVDVLLCGKAADIAIKGSEEIFLKPNNVSPQMLMKKMMKNGANVEVCPPYFPNAGKTKADLFEGISVAKPPKVADKILAKDTKILSY
ncbi:MAG: DsrE family protein [Helicobacteraceae bacterium]|nr:DsrE family protein [Helicobacteraceae bacterium]